MFGKLAVRNIPTDILSALEALALAHDRSTEAEARHAIRSWVEPSILKEERNARRAEVAERLGRLLEQANCRHCSTPLRPSHIALGIGEQRAEEVEDWFLGRQEPTFKQLEAVAQFLGAQPKWLQHGDGHMFFVEPIRLSENPVEAVTWLTDWDSQNEEPNVQLDAVYFVRELSKTGALLIIKKSSRGHYRTFTTPYHVSEEIGAGGEGALSSLFVSWELLYNRLGKISQVVASYLVNKETYNLLRAGNTIPTIALRDSDKSTWWEDIWDEKMQSKHEYWPGWTNLCQRITRCVTFSPHLSSVREQIRNGEVTFPLTGQESAVS